MREIKVVPQACTGDDAPFSGHVVLRMPTLDERYAFFETMELKQSADGEVAKGIENLAAMRKMILKSKAHYISVSIVRKSDGLEFASFDDLSYDKEAGSILQEIAGKLMEGFSLVKN